MAHPQYYRIKAAALAWELAQERLGRELTAAQAAMKAELAACELDSAKNYRLNDQTHDVEVAETPEA